MYKTNFGIQYDFIKLSTAKNNNNSNKHKTVICALHSRYYCRWIGCYCLADSIMQRRQSTAITSVKRADSKTKVKKKHTLVEGIRNEKKTRTSSKEKKTSTKVNNNSKIITIKRSAARTHNKNKCIVFDIMWQRSQPTSPAQPTNVENAIRIIGANGENCVRSVHTYTVALALSLLFTSPDRFEKLWLIDKDFMFESFCTLKCLRRPRLLISFTFFLLSYSHTVRLMLTFFSVCFYFKRRKRREEKKTKANKYRHPWERYVTLPSMVLLFALTTLTKLICVRNALRHL